MGFLEKWQPSEELERFRSEFDGLLERLSVNRDWSGPFRFDREFIGEPEPARPAIESRVEDGKFIVRTDLPGIDPKDVDIKVVGDVLTIKGSREKRASPRRPTSSDAKSATASSSVRSRCPRESRPRT